MSDVEKVKSYIGVHNATDIRSLLRADHEQFGALTEEISSDASTQRRVGAFDGIEGGARKASWTHPSDCGQRAESRIAERAATALLRAMENSAWLPVAFVLDEEDWTVSTLRSPVACGSDAID